jgi:cell division protein FtsB
MQVDSLFKALDSLKLPAILIALGVWIVLELRSLKKSVHEQNIAKEDKHVVEKLANDFKGLTMRHNDAMNKIDERHSETQKKADQRFRVHELTILALTPEDQKHHVIADLKGD